MQPANEEQSAESDKARQHTVHAADTQVGEKLYNNRGVKDLTCKHQTECILNEGLFLQIW